METNDSSSSSVEDAEDDPARQAEFLRYLAGAYSEAYASALVIVGNRTDADDVIQEVCVLLWKQFDEFEPGTNFRKWACSIAFLVAKNFVRKQRRRTSGLSDYAMLRIEHVRSAAAELMELRRELLYECVAKLSERDRKFLDDCYCSSVPIAAIARAQRDNVETVYTRLKRLRKRLTDCIERTLGKGY
ncbi:sigma-70 family RNA polymerase sigma factor [Planctomicrobium sp. SH661]|uniref:sigma-70 family RNA polymerase sigma factor n=1 Tax=Planctomicrobium sp. SH661 TaxID=3448124 RepID=UPI003F5C7AEC